MASLIEITAGRRHEGTEVQRNLNKAGSMMFDYKTYQRPGGRLVDVQIGYEPGDGGRKLKLEAIDKALRAVVAKGFELPDLTFYCTSAAGVPCVAYMGDVAGNPRYTVFMGPKTGQHNPQARGPNGGMPGGLGTSGMRGIADQVYDGTQRWFGNPKMHAHATTVVIHELGHVLHDVQSAAQFWDYKLNRDPGGYVNHASNVSHYATTNALEFVAETFAGVMSGKRYGGTGMAAYGAVGGPMPAAGTFP